MVSLMFYFVILCAFVSYLTFETRGCLTCEWMKLLFLCVCAFVNDLTSETSRPYVLISVMLNFSLLVRSLMTEFPR